MPRPRKCRRVCRMPIIGAFEAKGAEGEAVILTVDEYECLRLVDHLGFSQEKCADYMQISRATAQSICDRARKKVASALVEGRSIHIAGGDYRLCDGEAVGCDRGGCRRRFAERETENSEKKGERIMKLAVTHENGRIFQHFGHTAQFKVYLVEEGKILSSEVVDTNGQGHGALAAILEGLKVDALICGGIGGGAQMALAEAGIKLYGGVSGACDAAVEALLAGQLGYDPNVKCDHHDHEHGAEAHACGDHGCGKHSCH